MKSECKNLLICCT